jgi:Protein of unknown function (DUF4242)
MPKFMIERDLKGAGALKADELKSISQSSCAVLKKLGSDIQWIESYVTNDRIYCVYLAATEDLIRKHAEEGGFPVTKISEIKSIIDPATAE